MTHQFHIQSLMDTARGLPISALRAPYIPLVPEESNSMQCEACVVRQLSHLLLCMARQAGLLELNGFQSFASIHSYGACPSMFQPRWLSSL